MHSHKQLNIAWNMAEELYSTVKGLLALDPSSNNSDLPRKKMVHSLLIPQEMTGKRAQVGAGGLENLNSFRSRRG